MKETEKRDGKREKQRERQRGRETPNTDALARPTLKITIGCLCRGPSRRFQGACRFSTHKNLPDGQTLWSVFQDGSNETEKKKKRVHVSWSSQAVLEMAAFGAHARQASADEPSGARLFSGFWVEVGQCAHDHISANTSVVRRRFSGRDSSGAPRRGCLSFVLMLPSDQSGRNARISRGFRPSTSHWRS